VTPQSGNQVSTSLGNSGLCWTVFARKRDTAVPAERDGDLQTLIRVLVVRPRRCLTLSNPVTWQNWMAAYLGYTLRMKTLFRGWPVMVNDAHTRRKRFNNRMTLTTHTSNLLLQLTPVTADNVHFLAGCICNLVRLFVTFNPSYFSNQGPYPQKVVDRGRWYDRSYDWCVTAVGIRETNRKNDRTSTTYLQLSYVHLVNRTCHVDSNTTC